MWMNKFLKKLNEAEQELPSPEEGGLFISGIRQSLSSIRARINQEKANVNLSLRSNKSRNNL